MSLTPEAEYPMESFEWGLPAVQIDVPSFSMTGDIAINFQSGHFSDIEQFKFDSQNWPYSFIFTEFGKSVILLNLGETLGCKKAPNHSLWEKIQGPCIVSCTSHFKWFSQGESRTGFLNWVQSISFCNMLFFWFVWQNKICVIRINTQKVLTWLGKYFLNSDFFIVLARTVFRAQPKVYSRAFLQK